MVARFGKMDIIGNLDELSFFPFNFKAKKVELIIFHSFWHSYHPLSAQVTFIFWCYSI
jgi:hypothetical protein